MEQHCFEAFRNSQVYLVAHVDMIFKRLQVRLKDRVGSHGILFRGLLNALKIIKMLKSIESKLAIIVMALFVLCIYVH